jgi:hypothetical protein
MNQQTTALSHLHRTITTVPHYNCTTFCHTSIKMSNTTSANATSTNATSTNATSTNATSTNATSTNATPTNIATTIATDVNITASIAPAADISNAFIDDLFNLDPNAQLFQPLPGATDFSLPHVPQGNGGIGVDLISDFLGVKYHQAGYFPAAIEPAML